MTFHVDVLDAGGKPARATFSTLYSPATSTATANQSKAGVSGGAEKRLGTSGKANGPGARAAGTASGGMYADTNPATVSSSMNATSNAVTAPVAWRGGGNGITGVGSGGGCAEDSGARSLALRGGAIRCPLVFDTSRSRGWTVVAVDMVALMRDGRGGGGGNGNGTGGGKGYGVLKGIRLGSNMVVRGVYVSDCVYSPRTLPREMAFRVPAGAGGDWEAAYGWLWQPEVRNGAKAENAFQECLARGKGQGFTRVS